MSSGSPSADVVQAARRLAECLSLTNVIGPQLLRRMRLEVVPGATTAAEALLWAGSYAESASADRLVLDPGQLTDLRAGIAADPARMAAARQVIVTAHQHLGPAVQLEDELIWLGMEGGQGAESALDDRLRRIAATLADHPDRSLELARWLVRILPSMPPGTQRTEGAEALRRWATAQLDVGGNGHADRPADVGEWRVLLDDGGVAVRDIGVRLVERGLEIVADPEVTPAHRLAVPDGEDVGIELVAPGSDHRPGDPITVDPGSVAVTHLALLGSDGKVRPLGLHLGPLLDVAASGAGPTVVTLGPAGEITVREPGRSPVRFRARPATSGICAYEGAAGPVVVATDGMNVGHHDARTGRLLIEPEADAARVTASDDGSVLVVQASSGAAQVFAASGDRAGEPVGVHVIETATTEAWPSGDGGRPPNTTAVAPDGSWAAALVGGGQLAVAVRGPTGWGDDWRSQGLELGDIDELVAGRGGVLAFGRADRWSTIRVTDPSRQVTALAGGRPGQLVAVGDRFAVVDGSLAVLVPAAGPAAPEAGIDEAGAEGESVLLPGRFDGSWASCPAGAVLAVVDAPLEVRVGTGERTVLTPLPRPPLGARLHADGTSFRVAVGEQAERVELHLFLDGGKRLIEQRVDMERQHDGTWSADVDGVGHGARYGYRVHGPIEARHNPAKLLLDPWAFAVTGELVPDAALGLVGSDGRPDPADSAPFVPRSVVCELPAPSTAPRGPLPDRRDMVLYEVHVKGATVRHPDVPRPARGTYAGLAHDAFVEHLLSLGITHVVLLPVAQFVHQPRLLERGLRNYWGFDPVALLAPHEAYAASGGGGQVAEFRSMVDRLHDAGIGVVVSACFNHTAEGDPSGPTLAFRGLDDARYYRSAPGGSYEDLTGTGNTLDARQPLVQHLVSGAMRHWVEHLGVDGFVLDLAVTLGRGDAGFDPSGPLLELIRQDPAVGDRLLIVEPWDVGPGGYAQGLFGPPWLELDGRFRDTVRDHWRRAGHPSELADAMVDRSGAAEARRSSSRVTFVTMHDGFTLTDLVSYDRKHNEANPDGGRDGADMNRSWNSGVEGPTEDPTVLRLRDRQRRNLLTTLFVARGTPLLLGGDELGRTQNGNNNAWCQDNELSWFDWGGVDRDFLAFVRHLVRLRADHPILRRERRTAVSGPATEPAGVVRLGPDGTPLGDEHPDPPLVLLFNGAASGDDAEGEPGLLIIANGSRQTDVVLPARPYTTGSWRLLVDTEASPGGRPELWAPGPHPVGPLTMLVFAADEDQSGAPPASDLR